jgi:S1-C subfamily serine protease
MKGIYFLLPFLLLAGCTQEETGPPVHSRSDPAAEEPNGDALSPIEFDPVAMQAAFVEAAKRTLPAVVHIQSAQRTAQGSLFLRGDRTANLVQEFFLEFWGLDRPTRRSHQSMGSGFIIRKDGYILTNYHVVDGAGGIEVTLSDNTEFTAEMVRWDKRSDLALVKIRASDDLPTADLGDSAGLEVGEWSLAIGNPFGLDHTVTVGVISAKGRVFPGRFFSEEYIQTDAGIYPGNSGGPLINIEGEVVGINTAILTSGQGIGFAIPIDRAKRFVRPVLRSRGF